MRNFTLRITAALICFTTGVAIATGLSAIRYAPCETPVRRVAVACDVSLLEAAERVARTRDYDPSYLIADIAVRYAEAGEFDKAISLVNTVEDDSEKAAGKAKIAARLWKNGDRAKALELFDSLRVLDERGGKVVPRYHSYTLGIISEQLAAAEQYDKALELAAAGGGDHLIRTALDAVADNYKLEKGYTGESELLTRVVALAQGMTNGEGGRVIQKVALIYAQAGQYDRAVRMAEELRDPQEGDFDRDETLKLIALALAAEGQYDRAVKLARKTDDYFRNPALTDIAGMLIDAGRADEALRLLPSALHSVRRDMETDGEVVSCSVEDEADVAVRYAQAGKKEVAVRLLDDAFGSAKEVRKFVERDGALKKVAADYAASEFYDKALSAAEVNNYTYQRSQALSAVAVEMVKAGRVDEVRRAVSIIEGANLVGSEKANALSDVAAEYLKSGKKEAAKKVLARAFESGMTGESDDIQQRALASIAAKYAEAGDFEKALEVAGKIRTVFDKTVALADIGVIQGKSGAVLSDRSRSILIEISKLPPR